MSDVGRYRRAYPRLYRHPEYRKLARVDKELVQYALFGPQSNRIGILYFSVNVAAEDLDASAQSIRRGLRELGSSFGWCFDAAARVLYIPSWWRWNAPDHEKVLRGNLKDLNDVPPCALVDAFAQNLTYLKPELHACFMEAYRVAVGKASGSQYQSSVSGKQEQEPARPRGSAGADAPKFSEAKNGQEEKLNAAAREVLRDTPTASTEYQVDDVLSRVRDAGFTQVDAKKALHAARLGRAS